MTDSRRTTKQRMNDAAVALLREHGAAGVTVEAVLARSGAPRGSVYHHFPGGRDELLLTAARQSGEFITSLVAGMIEARHDTREVIADFIEFWKNWIVEDGFTAGCPIVALALDERPDTPAAHALVEDTFAHWRGLLRGQLRRDGVSPARSRQLATVIVASIEGAIVLARAQRSATPLDDVAATLIELIGHSVPEDTPRLPHH